MTRHDLGESFKALDKAKDAIENAEYNLKGGFVSATANRAYYGLLLYDSVAVYKKCARKDAPGSACKIL